jgi:hypothetical protein
MLANVRHDGRSRIQSMTSPRPVRGQSVSAQCPRNVRASSGAASAQRPMNRPGIGLATAPQCPSSCRKPLTQHRRMSAQRLAQQPGSIRAIVAEVREPVRLVDVQLQCWRPVNTGQHPANRPRNFQRSVLELAGARPATSGQPAVALSSHHRQVSGQSRLEDCGLRINPATGILGACAVSIS